MRVAYGINADPKRWGYHLLGLDFDIEVALGFPVIEARVEYPGEGYAGYLGWSRSCGIGLAKKRTRR